MSYCIAIPTINRKDLLVDALSWYLRNLPTTEIIVLDNGQQGMMSADPRLTVFESKENLGVAGSWNWLMRKAFDRGYDNILMLNDDVILQRSEGEVAAMIDRGTTNTFHRCRSFYNWSVFILRKPIFEKVGDFDENFKKCFFEDNDYEYRMRLSGVTIKYEDDLNPQVYRNSQTIEKNPLLGGYLENREYYIKKWGGLPDSETYKTPYGI